MKEWKAIIIVVDWFSKENEGGEPRVKDFENIENECLDYWFSGIPTHRWASIRNKVLKILAHRLIREVLGSKSFPICAVFPNLFSQYRVFPPIRYMV